jgi:hypothetical protein
MGLLGIAFGGLFRGEFRIEAPRSQHRRYFTKQVINESFKVLESLFRAMVIFSTAKRCERHNLFMIGRVLRFHATAHIAMELFDFILFAKAFRNEVAEIVGQFTE